MSGIIPTNWLAFAADEIRETYGHRVSIGRKALHKFGRNDSVGTTKVEIVSFNGTPLRSATNAIDTISSSDVGDTQAIRVEGMTISGNVLTFSVQSATLNGQNKVVLGTPLSRVTRVSNSANPTRTLGDVYVYADTAITGGIPTDISQIGGQMSASDQSSLFAGTSVASTNYFVMTKFYASIARKQAASANITIETGQVPNITRTIEIAGISTSKGGGQAFEPFYIIPPNSDVTMTAISDTAGTDILAGFEGFFADIIV